MASIGLYDIDFNHGKHFSISLPLMKAYRKLREEGHLVVMMKPYEKTGRFNKVFYFKEGKDKIPNSLTINSEKGKMVGYGFYGQADLLPETVLTPPDFTPYELNADRIKNKALFNAIKRNSIVDWREKDFTGVKKGVTATYINDRDFMQEHDWEDIFDYFDNNIIFVNTLYPTVEQVPALIKKNYQSTRIAIPLIFDEKITRDLLDSNGVLFSIKDVPAKKLLGYILFCKTISNARMNYTIPIVDDPDISRILKWGNNGKRESYVDYCKREIGYLPIDNFHFNFSPKQLLYQDPMKITPK